jgi:hypothetical protein
MVKQTAVVKQDSSKEVLAKVCHVLHDLISGIPFIKLKYVKANVRPKTKTEETIIKVFVSGKPVKFIVEAKSQGEPRIIRAVTAELKAYLQRYPDSYGIIAVPYISDAGRQICKEAGIGCIDLAGNVFLSLDNIFIDKSGRPNPFPVSRLSRSVFSPKSSRILRVLLADPSKRWYVEDLSLEAGISIGLTSRVKQALLAEEWVNEENKRFYLTNPKEVLDQWVRNYSYSKNQSFSFYSGLRDDQIETAIKSECEKRNLRYALGLFSGAGKVAPFVRFMRFFSYVDRDIEGIAKSLQLKKVESGANVTLLQPYDDGVFYGIQNINGIKVVSDVQLYLDLKSYRGRGEEAAQAIFEQRINPKW